MEEDLKKIKKEIQEFNSKYNTLIQLYYGEERDVHLSISFKI